MRFAYLPYRTIVALQTVAARAVFSKNGRARKAEGRQGRYGGLPLQIRGGRP